MNNQLIEPISGMFKIIFLKFKPNHKIGIYQNKIHLMDNNVLNASIRMYYSFSREQIIYILDLILRLIFWFSKDYIPKKGINNPTKNIDIQNKEFMEMLKYFIEGLKILQNTYQMGTTYLTLQYYITIIQSFIDNNFDKKILPSDYLSLFNHKEINLDISKLSQIWTSDKLNLIYNYIKTCNKYKKTNNSRLLNSTMKLIEDELNQIHESFTDLLPPVSK